ncbi:MAG TPA: hypothetical protein VMD76_01085 [Candidatus Sulfotelmatobacter sp.]|nr:hypothetical protein [Candidatus Sulfotelmatobacter sp.]
MNQRVSSTWCPHFLSLFLAANVIALNAQVAQTTASNAAAPLSYVVGGTPIVIPPPSTEFSELGDDSRKVADLYVPAQNRLIAAFYPAEQLALFKRGKGKVYSRNGLVEASRRSEFTNYTRESFQDLVQSINKKLGASMDPYERDAQDQLNRRVQELNLNQGRITLGQPFQLGSLFSKEDAFAFAFAAPSELDGVTSTRLIATIVIRVRSRVVFAYLSDLYKGPQTMQWVQMISEQWADAILNANKE